MLTEVAIKIESTTKRPALKAKPRKVDNNLINNNLKVKIEEVDIVDAVVTEADSEDNTIATKVAMVVPILSIEIRAHKRVMININSNNSAHLMKDHSRSSSLMRVESPDPTQSHITKDTRIIVTTS